MPPTHRLSAAQVRTVSEPGQYSDGNGLTLRVERSGSKHWVQRVTIKGKRHNIGLGSLGSVSLADAREKAASNQRAIKQGLDPLADKHQAALELSRPSCPSFAQAAEEVIVLRAPTWSNAKHAAQWRNTLTTYAFPVLGNRKVADINSGDVLQVLTPIWHTKPETASRVRQRMETVLDLAIAQGWRDDNPAGKSITRVLPPRTKSRKHYQALPYSEVASALDKVRKSNAAAVTRLSFEFLVLTAARSGEVRKASWSEIDLNSKTWTVPADRMKARKEHRVPLSWQALGILDEARKLALECGDLVFPGSRNGGPLSDMTYTTLLRRLEIPAVAHGFRSSFRDWVMEQTDTPWAIGEAALAHNLGNSTETAYARSDLFNKRRSLMQGWANFVIPKPMPVMRSWRRGKKRITKKAKTASGTIH
ncbi:MAG: integrase arm-type DNA-binding domain-containing protein [Chloroflexi bacterium]|nr:integrase arm-type DNA-binding domain-containing protein [Chloroflexota bacterium]